MRKSARRVRDEHLNYRRFSGLAAGNDQKPTRASKTGIPSPVRRPARGGKESSRKSKANGGTVSFPGTTPPRVRHARPTATATATAPRGRESSRPLARPPAIPGRVRRTSPRSIDLLQWGVPGWFRHPIRSCLGELNSVII
ncbi:hypothetical protein GUJ93_ZPchr0014g46998 [Zizania palustris]|uniref:Uncharacterized protein n=1 Tax=Zizania palustris TaxID=103762 RepID=A0A8J5SXE5_ZIZPA|nr:hypothetical protein GUJ93_ZPchr0014g46998 [Zizania palustris]